MRTVTAAILAPVLAVTGFQFSKHYRWGTTRRHRVIYACVDTVGANLMAIRLSSLARRHADTLIGLAWGAASLALIYLLLCLSFAMVYGHWPH
jgi:hypothetical protein